MGKAVWHGIAALPGPQHTGRGTAVMGTLEPPALPLMLHIWGGFTVLTIRQTVSKLALLCPQAVFIQHRDETFSAFLHQA